MITVKQLSKQEVVLVVSPPPGETIAERLAAWKGEVLALKRQGVVAGATLYVMGALDPHQAGFLVETLRSAARNILIQAADTGDFLRVSGIDPDAQVIAALEGVKETLAALAAVVPPRQWRAICLSCRYVWEAIAEPRFCPQCKSGEVAAREISEEVKHESETE